MDKKDYEIYLLTKVDWWLFSGFMGDNYLKESIMYYHGDVFGVRTIMEAGDLEKMAKKHNLSPPGCIVGG
jgi:hypothetical protein